MIDWSVVIGLLGAGAAITMAIVNAIKAKYERRNARLSTTGERAVDMVEHYHDGLLRIGSDNKIICANRQARLMTGYSESEIVGMNVNDLVPPQLRKQHLIDIRIYRGSPRVRMMGKSGRKLYLLTKRGDQVHVLLSLTPGEPIDNGPEVTVGMRVADSDSMTTTTTISVDE